MKSIELPEMKLNNLCSHYKDSYDIHRETIKRRDKLFYSLLAIIAIFTLQVTSTEEVNTILSKYILKQGINLSINFHFISTLIWLILLGFSIRYFQIVIEIQRQYSYLHKLEEELNKYYKNTLVFTREGKSYFQNYPLFSNWLWLLYTAFFPMLILISIYYRIKFELNNMDAFSVNIFINFTCYLLIGTSTVLYTIALHRKNLKRVKNRISQIMGIVLKSPVMSILNRKK